MCTTLFPCEMGDVPSESVLSGLPYFWTWYDELDDRLGFMRPPFVAGMPSDMVEKKIFSPKLRHLVLIISIRSAKASISWLLSF